MDETTSMPREEIRPDDLAGIANWLLKQRATRNPRDDGSGLTPLSPQDVALLFHGFTDFELIGSGGMGAVYRATEISLDRQIAIKILSPSKMRDSGFRERFAREALTMAQLNHPAIVSIYATGEVEEHFYIIMEFVGGGTLRDRISSRGIPEEEAVPLFLQICEGLEIAHQSAILHRDIKPGNILLTNDGHIKITDFGLAKLLDESKSGFSLTLTDFGLGTPVYMSPEQIRSLRHVDRRSDIYSLGVVLYEMLTGNLPMGKFPPPPVSRPLRAVILKALESDPDERFQSIAEMRNALQSPPTRTWKWLAAAGIVIAVVFWLSQDHLYPATNSLGMRFTPVPGTKLHISLWETRVGDFRAFAEETERADTRWNSPGFPQTDEHPVVNVTWHDAQAFCQWLTKHEDLPKGQFYRLPTDREWTLISGLGDSRPYLPWGDQQNPPPGSGNFADTTARTLFPNLPIIANYTDGHPATAPNVSTLPGNVWEWTDNAPDENGDVPFRGGSWTTETFEPYLPGLRMRWSPDLRRNDIGFRTVLDASSPES